MNSPSEPAPRVSAYIPCFNNAATLKSAIAGIERQTLPVDELFVVDDASTDDSRDMAAALGIRVVQMGGNRGRGAVRARAMEEARNDLVLCCDATNQLQADFLRKAVAWLSNAQVAGVFARLIDVRVGGVVGRWRARHLFKQFDHLEITHRASLVTLGTLMRKSYVLEAGNFDPSLRQSEDYELGRRLLAANYDIIFDPGLIAESQVRNTLAQTMERFSRWNHDGTTPFSMRDFARAHVLALKILAPQDLREGDPLAAGISLLTPYFRAAYGRRRRKIARLDS